MTEFNKSSRTNNVLKISSIGTICNIINICLGFLYRTVFVYVLSTAYLGINGLFSNILQILSFADLGISTAIVYRFYKPISCNDVNKVGQLMNYFKHVYGIIAIVILVLGMALYPFLNIFIKDANEIPSDINIHIIYLLFLLQTLSSYMFVYKQSLLTADQRQYILSVFQTIVTLLRYILQLFVLFIWKNFTITLIVSITMNFVSNYGISRWVTIKYKEVFKVREKLPSVERKQILNDTKATLCHKIGATVLSSTDNIVLSTFCGLVSTGLYSNYSLIISSLNSVLNQLLGSFTSSLGNAHIKQNDCDKYLTYRRLIFLNFWISSVCSICIFNLVNDFISIWIGNNMCLDEFTVLALFIQFYLETTRFISLSYTNGCGLFVKDKIRPLIEASINLVVSIALVKKIGISGVFFGTIISHLCTVFWREPYLLLKYEFKHKTKEYWMTFINFTIVTFGFALLLYWFFGKIGFTCSNIFIWILKAGLIFFLSNFVFFFRFCNNTDLDFYIRLLKNKLTFLCKKVK